MTRIRIEISQEYELPDGAEIVEGPGGQLLQLNGVFLSPHFELLASNGPLSSKMVFRENEGDIADLVFASLIEEHSSVQVVP